MFSFTLRLFHQDSQLVFLIYIARFLHSYSPVVLTQFAVILGQPFYFYHTMSYSLRLANLNKLQVLIQFCMVCVYDTSHLFLRAFLIACEVNLALFSFLISLVGLLRSLHYSPCYSTCNSELPGYLGVIHTFT